jgi:hypothetical protein
MDRIGISERRAGLLRIAVRGAIPGATSRILAQIFKENLNKDVVREG